MLRVPGYLLRAVDQVNDDAPLLLSYRITPACAEPEKTAFPRKIPGKARPRLSLSLSLGESANVVVATGSWLCCSGLEGV